MKRNLNAVLCGGARAAAAFFPLDFETASFLQTSSILICQGVSDPLFHVS